MCKSHDESIHPSWFCVGTCIQARCGGRSCVGLAKWMGEEEVGIVQSRNGGDEWKCRECGRIDRSELKCIECGNECFLNFMIQFLYLNQTNSLIQNTLQWGCINTS